MFIEREREGEREMYIHEVGEVVTGQVVSLASFGEKDCAPEINTLDIIVDLQWHFPMDCLLQLPTECHFSAVCCPKN